MKAIGFSLLIIGLLILLAPRKWSNVVLHPGYGGCYRCNKTWDVVDGHSTDYGPVPVKIKVGDGEWKGSFVSGGCFPLCEKCWEELETPENRLPYYRRLVDEWKKTDRPQNPTSENKWPTIRAAVLAGG